METETLDKVYLEWSQFTKAKTVKEILLEAENARLREALVKLRDCDFVITPADRMDAVRDIARCALANQ